MNYFFQARTRNNGSDADIQEDIEDVDEDKEKSTYGLCVAKGSCCRDDNDTETTLSSNKKQELTWLWLLHCRKVTKIIIVTIIYFMC